MVCTRLDLLGEKKRDAVLEPNVTKIEGYSSIMFDEIFRGKYTSYTDLAPQRRSEVASLQLHLLVLL